MASMRTPYVCLRCRPHTRQLSASPSPFRRAFSISASRRANPPPSSTPRPPTAPKPTPNIKHIRKNADLYSKNCIDRNYQALSNHPYEIQRLSDEIRQIQETLREPQREIKQLESSIEHLMIQTTKTPSLLTDETKTQISTLRHSAQALKEKISSLTTQRAQYTKEIESLALSLPNLTSPRTPRGDQPKLVAYLNYNPTDPPPYTTNSNHPRPSHVTIGNHLNLLNFTSSALTTGWGWYFLTNEAALLEQALIQYALSVALQRGWKPVSPPSLVYSHIADACGFQPRDAHNEQQSYAIEQSERDIERGRPARCLAGTAEIPLAAMYAGQEVKVPTKLVGVSRCYRAEAGARGVDTKGLYRVHEFSKVELFGWGMPDGDNAEKGTTASDLFKEIVALQCDILKALNLPARVLEMPAQDLGASASRKRDVEVLFPSRISTASTNSDNGNESGLDISTGWGEVTSASICTDYQSRRLGTRIAKKKGKGADDDAAAAAGENEKFPHTVNGTAMAVPRIIAALLEHGWDERRGTVVLPEVLSRWMGGRGEILGMEEWGVEGGGTDAYMKELDEKNAKREMEDKNVLKKRDIKNIVKEMDDEDV
ncbi:Serine--tRNA ligase, mitochondrial [Onygenales sp. PD_12]|nr:Serine--tRNA ligase, mitochondrial [Onygenales sp. PD_12]